MSISPAASSVPYESFTGQPALWGHEVVQFGTFVDNCVTSLKRPLSGLSTPVEVCHPVGDVPEPHVHRQQYETHLPLIERLITACTRRHHLGVEEADDFRSEVHLRLIDQDCAIFRKFQNRCSLATYLTVVVERLLLDFRVRQWGKWRPSAEARRLGPVAIALERLMTRDGLPFGEACEVLRTNHQVEAERDALYAIAMRLPLRHRRQLVDEGSLEEQPANTDGPDVSGFEDERRVAAGRIQAAVRRAILTLEPVDRVALRLRFRDGVTVADIARTLSLDQRMLYRRFETILRELRASLEAEGITGTEAIELVSRPDLDMALGLYPEEANETAGARPSI